MCFAQLCKAYHGSFPASSTTALQACSQAKLWGCDDDLIIKGGALNVINALNGISTSVCWRFFDIIDQGRTFLHRFKCWSCVFVDREANGCPHFLARWPASSSVVCFVMEVVALNLLYSFLGFFY